MGTCVYILAALSTAIADEWSLDKKATSHDGLLDAFSMSLQYWTRRPGGYGGDEDYGRGDVKSIYDLP